MATAPQAPLPRRLLAYCAERFPLPAYLPMILLAAFAAAAYSRVSRGLTTFIGSAAYATAAFTLLAVFFTLRVADEHKDADVDRVSRPELPVPRGLVTLAELRLVAGSLVAAAFLANALLAPALLLPLAGAGVWLALMTREFFVREWLRGHPAAYLLSHMMIMPLLLLYASAVDWVIAARAPAPALWIFLAASYASGLVLEIGRKMRAAPDERPGVETYTATWGRGPALTAWLLALALSSALVATCALLVQAPWTATASALAGVMAAAAAWRFVRRGEHPGGGKSIELASAVWTLTAYALLAASWLERRAA